MILETILKQAKDWLYRSQSDMAACKYNIAINKKYKHVEGEIKYTTIVGELNRVISNLKIMINDIEDQMKKKQEITTTDLADFGSRERWLLVELLTAWDEKGLPSDFHDEEVRPMMNRNSGHVFLTNSDYQVAMMNGDRLEMWHTCFECGHEGFHEDCQVNDNGCSECNPLEVANATH